MNSNIRKLTKEELFPFNETMICFFNCYLEHDKNNYKYEILGIKNGFSCLKDFAEFMDINGQRNPFFIEWLWYIDLKENERKNEYIVLTEYGKMEVMCRE